MLMQTCFNVIFCVYCLSCLLSWKLICMAYFYRHKVLMYYCMLLAYDTYVFVVPEIILKQQSMSDET
jgi:hypothetical protein